MLHCPRCRVNYTDDHKICFSCQGELDEGAIKEEEELVREERRRRSHRKNPLVTIGCIGLAITAIAAGVLYFVGRIGAFVTIRQQDVVRHERHYRTVVLRATQAVTERRIRVEVPLLTSADVLRTAEERKAFAKNFDLRVAEFVPGEEMLLYCPVGFYECSSADRPFVVHVKKVLGGIEAVIGRTPAHSRRGRIKKYAEPLHLDIGGARPSDPEQQFVVSVIIATRQDKVTFVVAKE